jgi:uncharacterized RDD family membrane protein YckC
MDEEAEDKTKQIKKLKDGKKDKREHKGTFWPNLVASVIDQIISVGISLLILFLMGIILKIIGFKIVDRAAMMFFIYLVVNILYTPIMEGTKLRRTFGRYILKINE